MMVWSRASTATRSKALCWCGVLALAGLTGCTMRPDGPPPGMPQDDTEAFTDDVSAQVNVFGEVGGARRGPGIPIGDQGFTQHTFVDEGYDADENVSPDGKWLLFDSTRHSEHAGIYLQKVDGTAVTKLSSDDSDNAYPAFSPDGRQIAFCSTRSGTWNLYVMDTEGRNVVTVTTGNTQCVHPSFSPDGTRLVYSALGLRSEQWELWTVDLASGEKRQIGYGFMPSWSPDRGVDRIAFQRARQRGSRWFSLWTLDLIDGEAHRVTEVAVSPNAAIVSPSWSPDAKRLVFATIVDPNHSGTGSAIGANHRRGEQDIWTISTDGTDRRRLTDGNGINLSPVWSKDNQIYFVSDRSGAECIWSVRPEMRPLVTASAAPTSATPPAAAGADAPANPKDSVGTADTDDADK